jgi:hypothetical protein
MAYTEETAHRIRQILVDKGVGFTEKKMFSGLCFLVDDKLFCATHFDKQREEDLLLCRVGMDAYETALEENDCIPMDFSQFTLPSGGPKIHRRKSRFILRDYQRFAYLGDSQLLVGPRRSNAGNAVSACLIFNQTNPFNP